MCDNYDISLIILLDSSTSITHHTYTMASKWIYELFSLTSQSLVKVSETYSITDDYVKAKPCLRTSLVKVSSKVDISWNLDTCWDHTTSWNKLKYLSRSDDILSGKQTGTHLKDGIESIVDNILPNVHKNEKTFILILSDGIPDSDDQNPCTLYPEELKFKIFEYGIDVRFMWIGMELGPIIDTEPFECLFDPYFVDDSFYYSNDNKGLSDVSDAIQESIFNTYCEIKLETCNVPLYPVKNEDDGEPLFNIDIVSLKSKSLRYTFIADDDTRNHWISAVGISIYNGCSNDDIYVYGKVFQNDDESVMSTSEKIRLIRSDTKPNDYNITFNGDFTVKSGNEYSIGIYFDGDINACEGTILYPSLNTEPLEQNPYDFSWGKDIKYFEDDIRGDILPLMSFCVKAFHYLTDLDHEMSYKGSIPYNDHDYINKPTTIFPTLKPTMKPSKLIPTMKPTMNPTIKPTKGPTSNKDPRKPSINPSTVPPTNGPTKTPSFSPIMTPTESPVIIPTESPTNKPTKMKVPTYNIKDYLEDCKIETIQYMPNSLDNYMLCDDFMETEWRLELLNWNYDNNTYTTTFEYEVRTLPHNPYNHCGINSIPETLNNIVLQIPCECEMSMEYSLKSMSPNGFTNQMGKLYIWDNMNIYRGEYIKLELEFYDYVPTKWGYFYLEGKSRYTSSLTQVPFPCQELKTPYIDPKPKITKQPIKVCNNTEVSKENIYKHYGDLVTKDYVFGKSKELIYFPESCSLYCDPSEMEYSIELTNIIYNNSTDTTQFIYDVSTNIDPPGGMYCSMVKYTQPMNELHIGLPCDCVLHTNSTEYLNGIIYDFSPSNGYISDNQIHWIHENIIPGESKQYSITLYGKLDASLGLYTIGGNKRCGGSYIDVPNPCSDKCLFGQWTEWEYYGECSKQCDTGYIKRKRKCVSVCDGVSHNNNCIGISEQNIPCNTHECLDPRNNINEILNDNDYINDVIWYRPNNDIKYI